MNELITINKDQKLPVSSDYYALRKMAMDYIQKVGTEAWTDLNLHDPGITFAELQSYGITDLSYRQNLPIEDLLATNINGIINGDAQALFTPREILTTNPWTIKDFRKLLIDIEGVRNAWLFAKESYTADEGKRLYIDCKESALTYTETHHSLDYKGLYDVHVELEDSNLYGDLNSGNIIQHFVFQYNDPEPPQDSHTQNGFIEMRLDSWEALSPKPFLHIFKQDSVHVVKISGSINPADNTPIIISGNRGDNSDILTGGGNEQAFRNALRRPLFATFYVHHNETGSPVKMEDVPIVLYFYSRAGRMNVTLQQIKDTITDSSAAGIMQRYLQKLQHIAGVMGKVNYTLHECRNLCEDYVKISTADVEDYQICCDIEADTDSDLELLQAEVYYRIFVYMNPPINFYSWQELETEGYKVDFIFNGPQTDNGFIKDEELNNSELRKHLYASDIINEIMDLPGVKAVRNFSMLRVKPDGSRDNPQAWQIAVTPKKLPRFYVLGSKINFYKNNLPFVTDAFELLDTLAIIKAKHEKPKLKKHDIDIDLPKGRHLPIGDYYPLVYSLPPVYNLSEAGPLPPLTPKRLAETKQAKAYMLLYEQLYANWIAQVEQLKNFFNADVDSDTHTYASRFIANADLFDVQQVYEPGYNISFLEEIGESLKELYNRRNRIYNHLLARLGENYNDYLLLSNHLNGSLVSPRTVLDNKAELIKSYSFNSYNKARAINYQSDASFYSGSVNIGLLGKLNALLGLSGPMDVLRWQPDNTNPPNNYRLVADFGEGNVLLFNEWQNLEQAPHPFITEFYLADVSTGITALLNSSVGADFAADPVTGGFQITCTLSSLELWRTAKIFPSSQLNNTDINDALEKLSDYLNNHILKNRILPIEHILLRPRNNAENLFNICVPNNCEFCGDEDPYSFRMTFLLCGDDGFLGSNLSYRAYAEHTIRKEVPAHIMPKICWLSQVDFGDALALYETWLAKEVAGKYSDDEDVKIARKNLVEKLNDTRSMYPQATLHDCTDGNDDNRVFLGKTVVRINPNLNII